jgi:putative two-component system response regulator
MAPETYNCNNGRVTGGHGLARSVTRKGLRQMDPETHDRECTTRRDDRARARSILAVDDDPGVIAMLESGLVDAGFRVASAVDVDAARARLRAESFDLVICDYEMPGAHGTELLDYVSRLYPHLPFIMLTAFDSTDLARRVIRTGATDFLSKPCRIRDLVRHMEQAWERVERDRARITEAAQELLAGTIRALVAAIDAKDPHTASHSERVTALALLLGAAIGLSPDTQSMLEHAGWLHDVGKIGVPESILLKPGPLSAEERAVVRVHPERSAEIVQQVPGLGEVATVVRHHHERLDGAGYPDGIQGDAIPLLSRILAIADVYEALTANRAYRAAMSEEEARQVLRTGWGSHFDPALGAVFDSLDDLP